MKKSKTNKGITILESLVCIVIVGIGFVAMLQISAYSISSMDRAIENNKVNFLTEMMAEDESIGAPPGLPEDCCGK